MSKKSKEKNKNLNNKENVINIALAGNANVGKSVIFNQLTGLTQTIGNWPGKTVERKEGHLNFLNHHFNIVDLPGIYSLSTYSLEEIVSREYIVSNDVDIIINVIDGTNLERNLFLTFQLLELRVPLIIAINQMDIVRKRKIKLDFKKLEEIFKLPVIPVVAVHGKGVHQLLEEAIELFTYHHPHPHYTEAGKEIHERLSHEFQTIESVQKSNFEGLLSKKSFQFPDLSNITKFGKEVETKIRILIKKINKHEDYFEQFNYPSRFLAIKLLEKDEEILKLFEDRDKFSKILDLAADFREELEDYHGEDINTIISSEIYNNINKVIDQVMTVKKREFRKNIFIDKLDHLTTHSIFGYVILGLILFGTYYITFLVGNLLGGLLDEVFGMWSEGIYSIYGEGNVWVKILWDGGMGGLVGSVGGVLVYVVPFFLIIEILQDSGYLPRASYLMDKIMHTLGTHGKAIIPMILGFGCNVPACAGCRIMETEREKKISIALTSLIPCAAVMTVVLGLIGRFLGMFWVVVLFVINFAVVFIVGRILNKLIPGKCTELIMEMHEYRKPNTSVILKQTWARTKEFVFKSLPIIIILGVLLEILFIFNLLEPINMILAPITKWLGLPAITGIFLIYGILRKELTLALLVNFAGSIVALNWLMEPIQMIVFSLVTMLYVPCFATIVIIARNTNWKYALKISGLEIGLALLIGGIVNWGFVLISSFI
ncbi:MAG: ferrous iron transport protein B [Candidatus Lokiarchaeota archaeon]|nr:ferrous iron transport protein B [Candidatus Lokiarchaeota archaeon]